ncbi:hypothetical protein AB0I60_23110 [Actinosynnema sp. NPDC050436]|uniref:hypothetical protein n=1 Tax=Actinosynnema sp. NPDC050436 TaxID=3155659 RepID=UPI0033FDA6AB
MTTSLSPAAVNAQAARHVQTSTTVDGHLKNLITDVESVLSVSKSDMTAALRATTQRFADSVRKSALEHLNAMATNIRNEAKGQAALDKEHERQIINMPIETSRFLGATGR